MFHLNKKVEYALIALLHLDSVRRQDLVTTKDLAELYHLPVELLGKVMQRLARQGGVVESVQGAHGGYRLARPLEEVTLGNVIEAVEGPVQLTGCQDEPGSCDQYCNCNIREPVIRVQEQLTQFINDICLASFRRPASLGAV
jgi:Rrf2 family protein